jgi:hypothetical protein
MPRVGFELNDPGVRVAETVHASGGGATVIGIELLTGSLMQWPFSGHAVNTT